MIMDPDFAELHASVSEKVDTALKAIDLSLKMKGDSPKSEKYRELKGALLLWKDSFGEPESEDDVANGLILLNGFISSME